MDALALDESLAGPPGWGDTAGQLLESLLAAIACHLCSTTASALISSSFSTVGPARDGRQGEASVASAQGASSIGLSPLLPRPSPLLPLIRESSPPSAPAWQRLRAAVSRHRGRCLHTACLHTRQDRVDLTAPAPGPGETRRNTLLRGLLVRSWVRSSVVACESSPPPPPSSRVRSSVVACDTRQAGLAGPARTASSAGTSAWDQKYKLLLEFRTRFAHACPQQHCPVFGPRFGAWVHLQRSLANRGQLSKERVARLEAIGFVFDGVEARQVRLRAKEQFESLFDKRQKQGQEGKEGREGKGRWEWDAAGRKRGRNQCDRFLRHIVHTPHMIQKKCPDNQFCIDH